MQIRTKQSNAPFVNFYFLTEKNKAGRPSRVEVCALSEIPAIPAIQTTRRFDLDRDCIVQHAIDEDFDLEVYFARPLQIQGLK